MRVAIVPALRRSIRPRVAASLPHNRNVFRERERERNVFKERGERNVLIERRERNGRCIGSLPVSGPFLSTQVDTTKEGMDVEKMEKAEAFCVQASTYVAARPTYPLELYSFILSLLPPDCRNLVWDVGTGNGQAALPLAEYFDKVIATDVSKQQLSFAPKHPKINYVWTPVDMSDTERQSLISSDDSVDLVIMAQSLHWFDSDSFYHHVKKVLRKPGGIIAAWCYALPRVNPTVDAVLDEFYKFTGPFWDTARHKVDDEYRSLYFPFDPILNNGQGIGPTRFEISNTLTVEDYLMYICSWSVLQRAAKQGVVLLKEETENALRKAWEESPPYTSVRTAIFPIFLLTGTLPKVK